MQHWRLDPRRSAPAVDTLSYFADCAGFWVAHCRCPASTFGMRYSCCIAHRRIGLYYHAPSAFARHPANLVVCTCHPLVLLQPLHAQFQLAVAIASQSVVLLSCAKLQDLSVQWGPWFRLIGWFGVSALWTSCGILKLWEEFREKFVE